MLRWPLRLLMGGLLITSSVTILASDRVGLKYPPINPSSSWCSIDDRLNALLSLNLFNDTTGISSNTTEPSHPGFPDLVYEYKVSATGVLSPIDFDYNQHVRDYIDIYTLERRDQVARMLGLAELFFPLFDEMLDKYSLPLELKYLAVVESALNPLAVSPSGAVGLWQFKLNTGRMFNLEVNSYIDQRMDLLLSTEAACQYLEYLYRIFKDWHLAMAAYNTGPGVVRNAIFRAGGETNYWNLLPLLPEPAQKYVPAFIAAAYVMTHAADHHIEPIRPAITYAQADTVHVSKPLSFAAVEELTGIPLDVIQFLNPTFRRGYVPELDKPTPIWLPDAKVMSFLERESEIYELSEGTNDYHDVVQNSGSTLNRIMVTHTVQAGDYLHKIAIRYGCTLDDINVWNPNMNSELAIGQKLVIWADRATLTKNLQRDSSR